jgi:hypothetical protein
MNSANSFVADDSQVDAQDMEDRLIHAIDHNNKAKILGYIKQDPSLLFSLIDSDEFLENPDKAIHMFTIMKKAGVNFAYQDEQGDSILHAVVEAFIGTTFLAPFIEGIVLNLASGLNRLFLGEDDEDKDDQKSLFLSDSKFVIVIKNTQKIVKALLKLGVKKNLKNHDNATAADVLKACIDEIDYEKADHKQMMHELQKLYKILK